MSSDPDLDQVRPTRQALPLATPVDEARAGVIETIEARHPIYATAVRTVRRMSKFSPSVQVGIILGGYVVQRILRELQHAFPQLGWVATSLVIVYGLFAILAWLARPIFTWLLRFHPLGKRTLSRGEVLEANWIGGFILAASCCFAASFGPGGWEHLFPPAVCLGLSALPLGLLFRASPGWPKLTMIGLMAALLMFTIVWPIAIAAGEPDITRQMQSAFMITFIGSIIAGPWIAAYSPRR